MNLRILLDEPGGGPMLPILRRAAARRISRVPVTLVDGDGDESGRPLLLSLYEEPEVGRRFRYQDLEWEIVEYRDGWLARLIVDET